jgi:hypothetical protein
MQTRPANRAETKEKTLLMSFITSAEHAYAVAIGDIKKGGTGLTGTVLPIPQRLHADALAIRSCEPRGES